MWGRCKIIANVYFSRSPGPNLNEDNVEDIPSIYGRGRIGYKPTIPGTPAVA